ncbi:MAG: ATP-dependent DNA ligase [Leptothrix sp. (in: b-proteobacteria)]
MKSFAQLCQTLDAGATPTEAHAALATYLADAAPADAAWAVHLLAGGKPPPCVPARLLRQVAQQAAGLDDWLFDACQLAVGDLAEVIALILPPPDASEVNSAPALSLAAWIDQHLLPLRRCSDAAEQALRLRLACSTLDGASRLLMCRLIGGGWRTRVSPALLQRALAAHAGLAVHIVAQRLVGYADARRAPTAARYRAVIDRQIEPRLERGRPHPLRPVHKLQQPADAATLGPASQWQAVWQLDGLRVQVIQRSGEVWIWMQDDELISDRVPELVALAQHLPDGTVLDGVLVAWEPGAAGSEPGPAPLARLLQRLARKGVSRSQLASTPVGLVAHDLLEAAGRDVRNQPLRLRRNWLVEVMQGAAARARAAAASAQFDFTTSTATPTDAHAPWAWRVCAPLPAGDWADWAQARQHHPARGAIGLVLQHLGGACDAELGPDATDVRAHGWLWPIEPMTTHAVLIYAQAGQSGTGGVCTDYTFAVWNRAPVDAAEAEAVLDAISRREPARAGALQLVTVARVDAHADARAHVHADAGLSEAALKQIDRVIRATTVEKFGPVRSLRPSLVFELAFDAIGTSARHKSGLTLREPRMLRIREGLPTHQADTLLTLNALLPDPAAQALPAPSAPD